MALPRSYRFTGKAVLADIVKLGLGSTYGALFGELQFQPRSADLGVHRMRGTGDDFPDDYVVRLGPAWLYYHVDEDHHVVNLLDLIPAVWPPP